MTALPKIPVRMNVAEFLAANMVPRNQAGHMTTSCRNVQSVRKKTCQSGPSTYDRIAPASPKMFAMRRMAKSDINRVDQIQTFTLYFIRHGETAWSLSGQHTGRTDIPLTAHGEDGARELEPCLREIQFTRVLTSPRQRARRTCELAGLGHSAEIEPDLSEWDYGNYEGRRSVDIRKERPDWNVFRDGCPRGETPAQVSDRADRLIAHLHALEGNVALFSHGQFGSVLARAMDRIGGDRRAAFCAWRGIAQHSRP